MRLTKTERIARRVAILRAIENNEKYTRSNAVLAPLAQADLIEIHRPPGKYTASHATLTVGGQAYLTVHSAHRPKAAKS